MSTDPGSSLLKWYIKEWREHRDLTQEQLAEMTGTNKGQISKLERGKQRKNDDWILKISKALNINPSELLTSPTEPSVPDMLRYASEDDRKTVRRMVEGFLRRK